MNSVILAASAVLGVASPAMAQEATAPASGARIEAIAGIDHVKAEGESKTGAAYGAAIGYDYASNGLLFGIDGEVAFSSTEGFGVDAGRDLYVGGRIGTELTPGLVGYAKAGYSNARVKSGGYHVDLDGVRLGLGLEAPLGSQMFVKVEYRYTNYQYDFERHQGLAGIGIRF